MKYLFILSAFLILSCEEAKTNPYQWSVKVKNGKGIEQNVTFLIDTYIIDSMKVKNFYFQRIASEATGYAKLYGVKYKATYEFHDSEYTNLISFKEEDSTYQVSVKGRSKNMIGDYRNLTSTMWFTMDREIVRGTDNYPNILVTDSF